MSATHEVTNQSTPFVDRNLYEVDTALREGVARLGAGWADAELRSLGARLGSAEVMEWARLANAFPPQLRNFDRSGRRIDEIEFNPSWHEVMRLMINAGVQVAGVTGVPPSTGSCRASAASAGSEGHSSNHPNEEPTTLEGELHGQPRPRELARTVGGARRLRNGR